MALGPLGVPGPRSLAGARAPAAPPLSARYPYADSSREGRLVDDIATLLHENPPSSETERKIKRWIQQVLLDAEERGRWWFLEAVASRWLNIGDDVIDIKGNARYLSGVWAPKRLKWMPLASLLELRQNRLANGRPNAGVPQRYALEAGRRVHLWPAPAARTPFCVLYTRPMHLTLVPPNWEGIVLDGVLGKYGRHFDRAALTQDPADFETRYERRLARSVVTTGHFDLEVIERYMAECATATGPSLAAEGGATSLLVPASVRGIEYDAVEDSEYPFEVS